MPSRCVRRVVFGVLVILSCAGSAAAQQNIPVRSWEVPRSDLGKLAVVPPSPFGAISPPCRLSDSRVTSGGPGPIPGGGTRDYDFIPVGSSACGSLPGNVVALSLYFTVVGPSGPGFLFAYPAGSPPPSPTSIVNYNGTFGEIRNNAAIVPVDPATGTFTVGIGGDSTDLIIDINGVFYNDLAASHQLAIMADAPAAILGVNTNPGGNGVGVHGSHAGFGIGVLGESVSGEGVQGQAGDPGGLGGWGVHGIGYGGSNNGVRGTSFSGGVGVFFSGGLAGTGTKSFIEPHPTDPALAIQYVSLEGPEAGTYFRGRAKFSGGLARIPVPESFRMVTAEEGLTILVTPIGEMASFAVLRLDLDEIVVKGSRNVEFCYTVNGVRRGYQNWNPITPSEMAFRPARPDGRVPENLSEDERSRLIRNGTYNPDGTVNLETARRLGWDKAWGKP